MSSHRDMKKDATKVEFNVEEDLPIRVVTLNDLHRINMNWRVFSVFSVHARLREEKDKN